MKIFYFEDPGDIWEHRSFPDGESYIRLKTSVKSEDVAIWCTLDHPNDKLIALIFLAQTLRDNGAAHITLVAPYLCYMRQDKVFQEGEAFSAQYCGALLSRYVDHIITVDPHLHRILHLSEVYPGIKTTVLQAHDAILSYIRGSIPRPFLIGPDIESEPWIAKMAQILSCPYMITRKTRQGDTSVTVAPFEIELQDMTPVVIDDIASSGVTLVEVYKGLPIRDKGPIALITHALFSDAIYEGLMLLYQKIITTNTIPHSTNKIDLSPEILAAIG